MSTTVWLFLIAVGCYFSSVVVWLFLIMVACYLSSIKVSAKIMNQQTRNIYNRKS